MYWPPTPNRELQNIQIMLPRVNRKIGRLKKLLRNRLDDHGRLLDVVVLEELQLELNKQLLERDLLNARLKALKPD